VIAYITLIRGTPMLIQILCAYYILPQILGFDMSPMLMATAAIGLNSAAYISQVIRTGIASVHEGQREAAQVMGFSSLQIARYIILPQAFTVVLPALGNEFVTLIKDSSLASIIGVAELAKQGRFIVSTTYDALSIFFAITILYLTVTSTISFAVSQIERRLKHVNN
jgi:ABC-type amino acid transport system permease subunit